MYVCMYICEYLIYIHILLEVFAHLSNLLNTIEMIFMIISKEKRKKTRWVVLSYTERQPTIPVGGGGGGGGGGAGQQKTHTNLAATKTTYMLCTSN